MGEDWKLEVEDEKKQMLRAEEGREEEKASFCEIFR